MNWTKIVKAEKYPKIVKEDNIYHVLYAEGTKSKQFKNKEEAQKYCKSIKSRVTKTAGKYSEQLKDLFDFTRALVPVLENLSFSIRFVKEDDKYVDFDSIPELIESIKNTKALASVFVHDVEISSKQKFKYNE